MVSKKSKSQKSAPADPLAFTEKEINEFHNAFLAKMRKVAKSAKLAMIPKPQDWRNMMGGEAAFDLTIGDSAEWLASNGESWIAISVKMASTDYAMHVSWHETWKWQKRSVYRAEHVGWSFYLGKGVCPVCS